MATGAIPRQQLDALPIVATAEPGVVTEVNGMIARYFSPVALTINGIAVTVGAAAYRMLFTPYLDLRGCSRACLTLRTVNATPGVRGAFAATAIYAQFRMGPLDAPAFPYIQGGGANPTQSAAIPVSGNVNFAATAGANEPQTAIAAWGHERPAGSVGANSSTFGPNQRFIVLFAQVALPISDASNLFTATLEATA